MRRLLILLLLLFQSFGSKAQSLYFPPLTGNSWDTISPSSLGWCQPQIDSLYDYLGQRSTKAFLVLKDGKIVLEKYFGTFTSDSLWYWASAGKSLTSVLVGIAQQENHLSIHDTTSDYLGVGWTSEPPSSEEKITIRHQLSMTTGLDDGTGDPDCTDDTCLVYLADAGTRWAYHNAPYTLLDDVISNATGSTLNNYLFQKLSLTTGMAGAYLPSGYNNVFYSKPRSMARFGLMMLNEGNWNGNQILDTSYFHEMINSSQQINPSYGYLWWLNGKSSFMLPGLQLSFNGSLCTAAPSDMFSAMGKNGQILNIVPSMNLILLRMGDPPSGISFFVPNLFNDTIWQKFNAVMCNTSGVNELNNEINIYPNPAKNYLEVKTTFDFFGLRIRDVNGRIMQSTSSDHQQIKLPLILLPGIYIIEIEARSGNIIRKKILIE